MMRRYRIGSGWKPRSSENSALKEAKGPDKSQSSDLAPEFYIPGLHALHEAMENYTHKKLRSGRAIGREGFAGLTVAISGMPDGLAGGILAGVNPVYGLYANMIGPLVGGIFSSTQLMLINNTSAVSLVAGQSIIGIPSGDREGALFLMVVLAGVFAVLFGLLRLGQMTRFVSYSVMSGFLAGIAAVLILSQLSTVTGFEPEGSNRIAKVINLLQNIDKVSIASLVVGSVTLLIAFLLMHTRLRMAASLVAIAVPSAVVAFTRPGIVKTVSDLSRIPGGVPMPALPSLADLSLDVFTGALSLALVILVQGAGVSQSVPNPDGSRRSISHDFTAQGVANIATGFFRGLPVGGSLSATTLNVVSGAAGRLSSIISGLWTAAIVIAFPGLIAYVALPALGGLLILIGFQSIKPSAAASVLRSGWHSRLAATVTFGATLILPIQLAMALGVAISGLLFISKASSDIGLVELVERPDGRIEEREPPKRLPANSVIVLNVYGDIFYAGARVLERLLPMPKAGYAHPAVILRLRGRTRLGATMADVLSGYYNKLEKVNGSLYLTGLSEAARRDVEGMGRIRLRAYQATSILGESTRLALADAQAWLITKADVTPSDRGESEAES